MLCSRKSAVIAEGTTKPADVHVHYYIESVRIHLKKPRILLLRKYGVRPSCSKLTNKLVN